MVTFYFWFSGVREAGLLLSQEVWGGSEQSPHPYREKTTKSPFRTRGRVALCAILLAQKSKIPSLNYSYLNNIFGEINADSIGISHGSRHYVVTYPSSTPWIKLRTVHLRLRAIIEEDRS